MKDRNYDEGVLREMLEWLSRGEDTDGHTGEVQPPAEMVLTEEDCKFLRAFGITIP
jgi:hypothetical protein